MGSLLFTVYVNDIVFCYEDAQFISYADDPSVFITGMSTADIERKTNCALANIKNWAVANILKLNSSKTKVATYAPKGKTIPRLHNISMGNGKIEVVDNIKILGAFFSGDLTWNKHVEYL